MAQQATFTITAVDATRQAFESVARNLENLNKGAEKLGKIVTGAFVAHEIKEFAAAIIEATIAFEKSNNLQVATLQATGNAAGVTKKQLEELAETLSKKTLFSPDQLRNAETSLLRFREISGPTFDEALKKSADLATALGVDVPAAAEVLGRALSNPEHGFRGLSGVVEPLTKSETELVKQLKASGDSAGAAAVIIDHLKNVTGLAEAANKGMSGSAASVSKAYEELLETFGKSQAAQATVGSFFGFLKQSIIDVDEIIKARGILDKLKGIALFAAGFRGFHLDSAKPPDDPFGGLAESAAEEAARIGRAGQLLKQADEAIAEDKLRRQKINAGLTKANAESTLNLERETLAEREQMLEFYYKRGELNVFEYYKARTDAAKDGLAAEVNALRQSIATQELLLRGTAENREKISERIKQLQGQQAHAGEEGDATTAAALAKQVQLLKGGFHAENEPAIREEIQRLQNRVTELIQKGNFKEQTNAKALIDEQQRLIDFQSEFLAKVADQRGDLEKAARLRQGKVFRELSEEAGKSGGKVTQEEVAALQILQEEQGKYNKAVREGNLARAELANQERDIASDVSAGLISEFEGVRRTDEARKAAVGTLTEYADAAERAAHAAGDNPEALQAVRNMRSEIKALAATADESTKAMRLMLEDSLNGPLIDFVNHTKSAKDAFLDFAKNVEQALLRLAVQNVSQGLFGGTSGGGAGAGVGAIAPYLAGLFSGGGGAAAASGSSLAAAQAGTTAAQYAAYYAADGGVMTPHGMVELKRYARGGIASRPQLALFGEGRQNEAYVPLPDGRRIPVAMKGGGGNVQHLTVNIQTPDAQSFKRSESQVITSIAMAGRRAMARR